MASFRSKIKILDYSSIFDGFSFFVDGHCTYLHFFASFTKEINICIAFYTINKCFHYGCVDFGFIFICWIVFNK